MTIPTLKKNVTNQETVSQLKKSYSTAAQAFERAEAMNGPVSTWAAGTNGGEWAKAILDNFAPALNIDKNCANGRGCFKDIYYKQLNGSNFSANFDASSYYAKARLADGSLLLISPHSSSCRDIQGSTDALKSVCASYNIDINGNKPPNQYGVDFFVFWITKEGIIPFGVPETTNGTFKLSTCHTGGSGMGCAAWVLVRGNTDYLSKTVDWD